MILAMVVASVLVVLASVMILWAVRRWLGAKWELGLSLAAYAWLIYDLVRLKRFCSAEPTYVAPTEAQSAAGSEGMMIFNCDGPGGVVDYFYLGVIGPGLAIVTLILALRAFLHLRKASIANGGGVA